MLGKGLYATSKSSITLSDKSDEKKKISPNKKDKNNEASSDDLVHQPN